MASTLLWSDLVLEQQLGEGQAGEVWRARLRRPFRELPVDGVVAIKMYKRWVMDQPGQHERMYRELTLGMKVDHPNVVKAYCLLNSPDGRPCLVMRYYEGITLEALLKLQREHREVIAVQDLFLLLRGIASGIMALHDVGALHRDVKPANVIVRSDGSPVLMDLGVVTETVLPEHTRTDHFLGTIRYAHPQYLIGARCGVEADTYSLGAIAYEMFSGEPFLGSDGNWATLVARVVSWRSPLPAHVAACCASFAKLHGHEAGEAAYWVIRSMIRAPQAETLKRFCDAVDSHFWTQRFFTSRSGEVVIGEPSEWDVATTEKWPFQAVDTEWSLDDMNEALFGQNYDDELAALIAKNYWDWRAHLDDKQLDDNSVAEIEAYLGFFFESYEDVEASTNDDDSTILNLARGLLILFRYGRLAVTAS
jgi:serine/threonine protein kinase